MLNFVLAVIALPLSILVSVILLNMEPDCTNFETAETVSIAQLAHCK
jgi:hypothetical protein